MTSRPLNERTGISKNAYSMLQYLQRIARGDRNFIMQDTLLNHRCNVSPDNDFTLILELFDAGKIDFDYSMVDGFQQRHVRLA
ncbi:hypothetical protein [Erwinia sp. S38]|uniref:hypothetical protein n=1 Tax=Erwinia sp. S38 TaxID=2769338 RepID=UPI00190DA1E1|nr:hypothetical protein [Erwinia sp. S38]MBK0002081.1 hypothetical protein [Erwinia sp. S38]